jgi:phenylpropionate dioxygenase-like ring-hydroxylating dioxygenase large terminal subunit
MSEIARKKSRSKVPFAIERPDRIPAQRYYDQEFYDLEREMLWPRVWQMACRLEEIPKPGDFVVYEIFEQSVIVTRVDEKTIKAYHNHCRHRGVKLACDRGNAANGFTCPFHGWRFGKDGKCEFVFTPSVFERDQLKGKDLALRECRIETWGGCAFINFDDNAPPLRPSIDAFANIHDAWQVESLRTEWWFSCRMPVNWKLAMEAFMEGYHVMATHPQLLIPGVKAEDHAYTQLGFEITPMSPWSTVPTTPMTGDIKSQDYIDLNLHFMRVLNKGMAGMTHQREVEMAEKLRDTPLPGDFVGASKTWRRTVNDEIVKKYRERGMDIADLNDVDAKRYATSVNFCFPHYFLLPMFGSASSYRIRPLGPEECLFELWSLTRFPPGEERPPIRTPVPMAPDDPRWPPIPTQDFANLPLQQKGLRTKGFEYMRLSHEVEGLISNNHRLIDGYLAGLAYDQLVPAAQKVHGRIDVPVADLGF